MEPIMPICVVLKLRPPEEWAGMALLQTQNTDRHNRDVDRIN